MGHHLHGELIVQLQAHKIAGSYNSKYENLKCILRSIIKIILVFNSPGIPSEI